MIYLVNHDEELKEFNIRDSYDIRCLLILRHLGSYLLRHSADYVMRIAGSRGIKREVCDLLLAQGKLEDAKRSWHEQEFALDHGTAGIICISAYRLESGR